MLFAKRQDYIGPFTGNALGAILNFQLTREFLIDSIYVIVEGTVAALSPMATANPDGIYNICKRITLQCTDGARSRNVVDVTGPGLINYVVRVQGGSLSNIGGTATPAAGASFKVVYKIPFRLFQIPDPAASMFLLPTNRFTTNPNLTLYLATQADMDQAAAPTFAVDASGLSVRILVNRRQVGLDQWPIFDAELAEVNQAFPVAGPNQVFELPTPGSYTGILVRGYTGVAPAIAKSNLVTAGGDYRIQVLSTVLRRATPGDLVEENNFQQGLASYYTSMTDEGEVFLDFLTEDTYEGAGDFGSVLDTNGLIKTGAKAQFAGDIAGAAGAHLNFLWHRIYGNLADLKGALKIARAAA